MVREAASIGGMRICVALAILGASLPVAAQQPPDPNVDSPTSPPDQAPTVDAELTPPVLTVDVEPTYPDAARADGLAAVVVVDIDIDAAGHVDKAIVVKGAEAVGYGFDEAALEAAGQLEFEPARVGEQAVPVRISYRFRFVPDVAAEPDEGMTEGSDAQAEEATRTEPSGELVGRLFERGTRLPLAGVTVTVFHGEGDETVGYEAETNAEGRFAFKALSVGVWRLLAEPDGFYPLRSAEEVSESVRTEVSYSIEKLAYNPYDVTVDASRVRREVNRTTIDARRAERIPGTFGDVLAVVQNFPGVARSEGGQTIVRGSDPEDSRVVVAGIEVPIIYHFGGLRSVLPVGMIERVDFLPGNFSVEYGRATGGIIDVDLKDLAPLKVGGYADVSIMDTSLYLEAPVTDDFAIALGGRRSYIDYVLEATIPPDFGQLTLPRYYDYQALASYHPSSAHHVETFFFGSDDLFKIIFPDPVVDPEFVISDVGFGQSFYRTMTEYRYVPSDRFDNEFKVSFGRDTTSFNLGELVRVDVALYQGQIRDTAQLEISDSLTLRAGVDYLYQKVDWDMLIPAAGDDDEERAGFDPSSFLDTELHETFHSTGVFTELDLKAIDSLLVVPGVRVDSFTRTDEVAMSPRLTSRYGLTDQWALKGGVGLFVQEPAVDETDEELGNPDLGLERAIHYSAGFEYRPLPYINLEVTGFYKTLSDLVSSTDAVVERDGETVPLRVDNGGEGRVVGLEVSARHELANRFFGWIAYTLSRSERRDSGESSFHLFDMDQTHILTVIGSYQLPYNWEISTRIRYVTGDLYTPMTGAVYDADADRYVGIPGALNSDRVGAFHQVDFRLDKRWVHESWMFNAYLDIQNVTNYANPEGVEYNYDFSETKVSPGLPIIPIIGLRGEF